MANVWCLLWIFLFFVTLNLSLSYAFDFLAFHFTPLLLLKLEGKKQKINV